MRPTRTLAAGCALALAAAPLTIATTTVNASAQEVSPARVAGEDRYATAAEVARFLYPDGISETVLGSGLDFPDALAGAPLAGANNSPLLLTDPDQVPAATLTALEELGVNQVTLLGGEAAISAAVAQDLESRGYVVGRVSGQNRYETAAELARAVYAENTGANFPGGQRAVFVTNGLRFPDALAASAPASTGPAQIPIVLVEQDGLPAATAQVLTDLDVDLAIIVGGTAAVSESVRQAIEDRGVNTDRIDGQNRTDTATNVAGFAQEFLGFDATSYLLARGDAFPDALAAGPLGGVRQDPILLTTDPNTLSSPTSTFLAEQCPNVEVVRAVGGPSAVTDDVLRQAEQAAESCASGGDPSAVGIAAVDADGRVVVLDGQTGEVRRVLMEGVRVDDPASNAIAVSPDREQVYVVRPGETGGNSDIVRVSASGGEPELVATGTSPALSPDGTTLAYTQLVDEGAAGFEPVLRLRDLATGQERELRSESDAFFAIQGIAWTEDSTRLAFTDGEIKLGLHVISATATSLDEARRLGPENTDASWDGVASLGADRLAVIEICCGTLEDPERWRVIEVDASTGAVVGEVFGRDRTEATLVDDRNDAAGLIVVQGGGLGGNPLLRWDGSGELREIAGSIVVAAW